MEVSALGLVAGVTHPQPEMERTPPSRLLKKKMALFWKE
jgi:hypothetical protein